MIDLRACDVPLNERTNARCMRGKISFHVFSVEVSIDEVRMECKGQGLPINMLLLTFLSFFLFTFIRISTILFACAVVLTHVSLN